VLQRVAEQKSRARTATATGVDVTPPVLTKLSVSGPVEAGRPAVANVKLTDDLSGVKFFNVYAHNSKQQSIYLSYYSANPQTKVQATIGTTAAATTYLETGDYTFDWGYAADAAGNYIYYSSPADLHNTVVTVINNKGGDSLAPQLVSGKIVNPKLSLAAVQPGTVNTPAYAGIDLEVSDEGSASVSGVSYASMSFCLADLTVCFGVFGNTFAVEQGHVTLKMGIQPGANFQIIPGTYKLQSVSMYDYAGNARTLFSAKAGGDTDFSQYFPGTKITIEP
jgi:hypothetical protein